MACSLNFDFRYSHVSKVICEHFAGLTNEIRRCCREHVFKLLYHYKDSYSNTLKEGKNSDI